MGRSKNKPKLNYKATTTEILYAISAMPEWAKKLYIQNEEADYQLLLKMLILKNFYRDDEKVTISKISKEAGVSSTKINKWLEEIYDEILTLNETKPFLFQKMTEINLTLTFKNFDEIAYVHTSLPVIPRVGDSFRFPFIKARVGTDYFYVQKIYFEIENDNTEITVALKGGIHNKYRDFEIDKAEFEGRLSYLQMHTMLDIEIDEILLGRSLYYKKQD